MTLFGPAAARAQTTLEAHYVATVAGITIGKGSWTMELAEDQYTMSASGRTTGVLSSIAHGYGTVAARGLINAQRLLPAHYFVSSQYDKKSDEVRMGLVSGQIKELRIEPPQTDHPNRVPLADQHRRNVIDPMSAALVPAVNPANPSAPENCARTHAIFDGRQRYDLALSFKRVDQIKIDKGYAGPVLVCAVRYQPLAGHRPDRYAVKYLSELRDVEVWLAPITGTRMLLPVRLNVPTLIGPAMLVMTKWTSPATSASAKTQ